MDEYRKYMTLNKSIHTVSSNMLVVGNWMREAAVEHLPPSAITAKHIANWINSPKLGWAAGTRRTALGSVRAFFEFCASNGWIVADPSRQVHLDYKAMSHEQKEKVEKEPFTDEEIKQLIKELKRDWELSKNEKETTLFRSPKDVLFWLVAVTIAKETGFRISDVANLEWRSFSAPGKIVVWTMKTGQRVEHKVSDALQNLVEEIPVTDAEYVFPEQRAIIHNPKLRASLSMQFTRLCERVGIEGKSFHSIRHYKATHTFAKMDKETLAKKLAESLSLDQIATLLGHANKKTTRGYVHEKK